MVRFRVKGWVTRYACESPHKNGGTRMCLCLCVYGCMYGCMHGCMDGWMQWPVAVVL